MSKTKISLGSNTWHDPENISVYTGTEWTRVNKVHVFTSEGWVEVWPVGFPNSGTLAADYWVITIWYRSGVDFDIRVYGCEPDLGQDDTTLIGWSQASSWPDSGTPILTWGGDKQGPGVDGLENRKFSCETVLVDVNEYQTQYPSATEIKIAVRGFYFGTPGALGVVVGAVGYVGGTPVIQSPYYWAVPDATDSLELQQNPEGIVVTTSTEDWTTTGEYMATFRYNLTTNLADFVIDEAGCPIPTAPPGGATLYYEANAGSVIADLNFSSSVPEGYIDTITATEKQIVTVPAGTFGAAQVPTKIKIEWIDDQQFVTIISAVWAVPWSGPFPPAGYSQCYYSYGNGVVYSPYPTPGIPSGGIRQISEFALDGDFELV